MCVEIDFNPACWYTLIDDSALLYLHRVAVSYVADVSEETFASYECRQQLALKVRQRGFLPHSLKTPEQCQH